jgi:Icc-related predicted phosphoesterase
VINRLTVPWPDRGPFVGRDGRPIRFLVASDEPEPALRHARNRDEMGQLDGIIGCGDLEPDWLLFLADAFNTPLVYVRGNHDRGGGWNKRPLLVPGWLEAGRVERLAGIPIVGLEWPGVDVPDNRRRPWLAWRQTIATTWRLLWTRLWRRPVIVISHVPPAGVGDCPTDAYHVGFPAYRWLLDTLAPPLWLHGHTTTASVPRLVERSGASVVANATGALLVELTAPLEEGTVAS